MHHRIPALSVVLISAVLFATPSHAQQDIRISAVAEFVDVNVRPWLQDPAIVNAIRAQNAEHATFSQAEINDLDDRWRAELSSKSKPLIEGVLSNPLSLYLKGRQRAAQGLITEIFVMDNRGLNVGQSDITSDYWQGDEAKWQKGFGAGVGGTAYIEPAERDESTQLMQSQASLPITDPDTGKVIGVITVGVNLDAL